MHVKHLFVEAAASNEHTPTVLIITSVLGSIAGVWLLGATVQSWWRRTFGRRRDRYARLARLGAGAHLTFFVAVLGEPPAMQSSFVKEDYVEWLASTDPDYDPHDESPQTRQVPKRFGVSTFIDRDYYVQTITDDDETVLAFSVTTRSRRFKPLYSYPKLPGRFERWRWEWRNKYPYPQTVQLRLGSSTFADLDPTDPDQFAGPHFRIAMGAHNHAYSEIKYGANPGGYQSFVWTASDAARQGRFGRGMDVVNEVGGNEWPDPARPPGPIEPDWDHMPDTQRFRRETEITTYTVMHPRLGPENYPLDRFGPHENDVRLLP